MGVICRLEVLEKTPKANDPFTSAVNPEQKIIFGNFQGVEQVFLSSFYLRLMRTTVIILIQNKHC